MDDPVAAKEVIESVFVGRTIAPHTEALGAAAGEDAHDLPGWAVGRRRLQAWTLAKLRWWSSPWMSVKGLGLKIGYENFSDEGLMMQTTEPVNHLDRATAQTFLERLPRHIREAFYARAEEIDYPIEAVLESAFTQCL